MSSPDSPPIELKSPPWKLKATIYTLPVFHTAKDAQKLPSDFLFSPLERQSEFAKGKTLGGIGMLQLIRYWESPVGPYDELLVVPGKYEYEVPVPDKKGGTKIVKKSNLRLTRIYVSTKECCYNGRKSMIPPHTLPTPAVLARHPYLNIILSKESNS